MPSTVRSEYQSCWPCKYFQQHLYKSGLNPIYESRCHHPAVQKHYDENGHYIGQNTDARPGWCPLRGSPDAERAAMDEDT